MTFQKLCLNLEKYPRPENEEKGKRVAVEPQTSRRKW